MEMSEQIRPEKYRPYAFGILVAYSNEMIRLQQQRMRQANANPHVYRNIIDSIRALIFEHGEQASLFAVRRNFDTSPIDRVIAAHRRSRLPNEREMEDLYAICNRFNAIDLHDRERAETADNQADATRAIRDALDAIARSEKSRAAFYADIANIGAAMGGQLRAFPPSPIEGVVADSGAADNSAEVNAAGGEGGTPQIPKRARHAHQLYQQACEANDTDRMTDDNAYDFLKRTIQDSGETLDLPTRVAFRRNLSTYRNRTGTQKNRPRRGREGGSVVRESDI